MVLAVPLVCVVLCQAPTVPLTGIVVGPNGEPLAGADVLLGGLPVFDQIVVARGKTDTRGRFTIERPAGLTAVNPFNAPILWVVKPGFRLGCSRFSGPMPKAGEAVRVALDPPGKGEVWVEDSSGRPVAGARIRLEWFGPEHINVPEDVENLIEATTNAEGRAVIEAASNDQIAYVDVHAREFGIQGQPFPRGASRPKHVRLRGVSALEGRLQADDPALLRGWRVLAWTYSGDRWSDHPQTTGFARGTTDAEGRFAFPTIATGRLELRLEPPRKLPVMADVHDLPDLTARGDNSLVVPLRRTVTVTGLVRERGTGRPVPDAEMYLSPMQGGTTHRATTDAQGRYIYSVLPGKWRVSSFKLPPAFSEAPGQSWRDFTIPKDQERLELEPWEVIPAAPPLRFLVRDEAGRPAAHARISGRSGSRYMPATTDDAGAFAVPGLPPNSEVSVEVRLGDRMTDGPVKATAGTLQPVAITIVPGITTALAGRVVGPDGTPIADAEVRLQYREKVPQNGGSPFPEGLRVSGGAALRTGPDGSFRTPKEFYRKNREFRIEVLADDFESGKTDWASADVDQTVTFPDLVLRPRPTTRLVAGRVVDRGGKGIGGVTVFLPPDSAARTETLTDDAGRFRIDGVPGGPALVLAEKDGYRLDGAVVKPGDPTVQVRLARSDEPPIRIPKPAPPPLSRAEERRIARDLIAPVIGPARAGSLGQLGQNVVTAMARVDLERALEMLENRVLQSQGTAVLQQVALGQFEDSPDEAIATIEADHNPAVRAQGFLKLADATADAQADLRLKMIDRALAEARLDENPESRLQVLGQIADRWLEMGLVDRDRPILRQGRAIIAKLPRDQYSFAAEEFADVLAVIDLRTATTIFERKYAKNVSPVDPATLQRHHGEAAVRLAAIDPEEAERLVPQMVPNFWDGARDGYLLRIAQQMAKVDLPRARRILDEFLKTSELHSKPRPEMVAEGLALMAASRAGTDPAGARALLDEAFDRFRKLADEGHRGLDPQVSNRMAALLPLVERIDPDRLEERLWLAAARRPPLFVSPFLNQWEEPVVLAALVARYDREMAAAIIAPALGRLPGALSESVGFSYQQTTVIKALVVYDPQAAAAIVRGLPPSARKIPAPQNGWQNASVDAQVRLAIVEALGLSRDEQYRKVLGGHMGPLSFRLAP